MSCLLSQGAVLHGECGDLSAGCGPPGNFTYSLILHCSTCVHAGKVSKTPSFQCAVDGHCCPIMQCPKEIAVLLTALENIYCWF